MEQEKSLTKRLAEIPWWYHHIKLPNGFVTNGGHPIDAERYGIPDDLTGKRVLDIGAWDGYWTWEALKRGAAEVVAIDDFSDVDCGRPDVVKRSEGWQTFDLCREAFGFINSELISEEDEGPVYSQSGPWQNEKGQKVNRIETSIYNIDSKFDVVFFFGTIYHLKHPLLALEKIAKICKGELYIESAICDDYSPYKGELNHGYPNNDVVMEYYPHNQYANNVNNWWVPTLQCLGSMVDSVGFKGVQAWALTDKPKELCQCRGFIYASKDGHVEPNVQRIIDADDKAAAKGLRVAAVMSVPRLGFQDNSFCVFEGLVPLGIPLYKTQGAFWGQCLERGIQQQIDVLNCDAVLTIDYDTVFKKEDVAELVKLMAEHPEADAIVPVQVGRSGMQALMTVKTKTGVVRDVVQRFEFGDEVTKIATGHFGLTLLRASSLMKMPHPWFIAEPDRDGQWGKGRVDADIGFWKNMEKCGLNVYSANRVVIGHLELVAAWPDENFQPIYQVPIQYHETGKPKNVWK